jgi:hypothetical protein
MMKRLLLSSAAILLLGGLVSAQSGFDMTLEPTFEVARNVHILYADQELNITIKSDKPGRVYLLIAPSMAFGLPATENTYLLETLSFDEAGTQSVTYKVPRILVGRAYELVAARITVDGDVAMTAMNTLLLAADEADGAARLARNWDLPLNRVRPEDDARDGD